MISEVFLKCISLKLGGLQSKTGMGLFFDEK